MVHVAKASEKAQVHGPVLVPVSADCEGWPFLPPDLLRPSRSRQVCMTCHLQQGLIAHGEHLTSRCQGWTEDVHRQRGWAPEVA